MKISCQTETKHVEINFDGDGPCSMTTYIPVADLTKTFAYQNTRLLSADLRDTLGLSDAWEFLYKGGVPLESGLWDMNHEKRPSPETLKSLDAVCVVQIHKD